MKRVLLTLLLLAGGLGLAGCGDSTPPAPTPEQVKTINASHDAQNKAMMHKGAPGGHAAPQ